jgi:iron complex transport system permease protein
MRTKSVAGLALLFCALVALAAMSLGLGRYPIAPNVIARALAARFAGLQAQTPVAVETILFVVRLPRIAAACCVGMALSLAGLSYQTVFRNPLASPSLLGVSAGSAFGACFALLLHAPWIVLQFAAFAGGLATVGFSLLANHVLGGKSIVTLVLCGLVISALFEALVSLLKYFADPLDTLPAITFWLMGGLERVTPGDLAFATPLLLVCAIYLYILRWRTIVLALGDQEAAALGIRVRLTRLIVIICATLMVADVVSLAGIIGWVGLIVPHASRMLFGLSPDRIYPATCLLGAIFLLAIDDVARSVNVVELPLGVLTALIGAPVFLILLAGIRTSAWV